MKDKEPKNTSESLLTFRFGATFTYKNNPMESSEWVVTEQKTGGGCVGACPIHLNKDGKPTIFLGGSIEPRLVEEFTGQWTFDEVIDAYQRGIIEESHGSISELSQNFIETIREQSKKAPHKVLVRVNRRK